jgi:hypothetical protein
METKRCGSWKIQTLYNICVTYTPPSNTLEVNTIRYMYKSSIICLFYSKYRHLNEHQTLHALKYLAKNDITDIRPTIYIAIITGKYNIMKYFRKYASTSGVWNKVCSQCGMNECAFITCTCGVGYTSIVDHKDCLTYALNNECLGYENHL